MTTPHIPPFRYSALGGNPPTRAACPSFALRSLTPSSSADRYAEIAQNTSINFSGAQTFSISCWVKLNDTSTTRNLISKASGPNLTSYTPATDPDYILWVDNNQWRFTVTSAVPAASQASTAPATLNLNQWYHIVGTFDGIQARIYVDNVLGANVGAVITGVRNTNQSYMRHLGWFFEGSVTEPAATIDDVRIYGSALSAAEITLLFNKTDYTLNQLLRYRYDQSGIEHGGGPGSAVGVMMPYEPGVPNLPTCPLALAPGTQQFALKGANPSSAPDYVGELARDSSYTFSGVTPFSIACWVRTGSVFLQHSMFVKALPANIESTVATSWDYGGTVGPSSCLFRVISSTGQLSQAVGISPFGQFVHYCGTFSGTTARIYLNGILSATGAVIANVRDSALSFMRMLGKQDTTGSLTELDDFRIYNRELTSTEALTLYNKGSVTLNLVHRYKFENSGADDIGSLNVTVGAQLPYVTGKENLPQTA